MPVVRRMGKFTHRVRHLVAAVLLAVCCASFFVAAGDVVYVDGNRLHYQSIPRDLRLDGYQVGGPFGIEDKGRRRTLHPSEVSYVTFLEVRDCGRPNRWSRGIEGLIRVKGVTLSVHLRNGEDVDTELSDYLLNDFRARYVDELTGKSDTAKVSIVETFYECEVKRLLVRMISFDETLQEIKYNPRTNELYPPQYVFDPRSGERLASKTLN